MIQARFMIFALGFSLFACAAPNASESLRASVGNYNQSLRWKRYTNAARFLPAEKRADFLQQYLSVEDDLHVQSVEVRSVSTYEREGQQVADVVLVAEAYLLPSTVVKKTTIVQTWELQNGHWELVEPGTSLITNKPQDESSAPL